MSRLIDPTTCPDCRAPLGPDARCTGCGLTLHGPVASELWRALVSADRCVEELRLAPVRERAGARAAMAEDPAGQVGPVDQVDQVGRVDRVTVATPGLPAYPMAPEAAAPGRLPRAPRVRGSSVPLVLLTLGGLCVAVAAVVFVAVAWSVIGLAGRTLILLTLTGVLAGCGVALTRKGLRGGAETLWGLAATMLTIDVLAAHTAGLAGLDGLSDRGVGLLVGVLLAAGGSAVALWARNEPVHDLLGMQLTAALGLLIATASNGWAAADPAVGCTAALVLLGVVAVAMRPVRVVSWAALALAVMSWLGLVLEGMARASAASDGDWFTHLDGWPLLAAAAAAAVPATVHRIPEVVRTVLAAGALAGMGLFVQAPGGTEQRNLLAASGIALALALVSALAPAVWARAAACWSAVVAVALTGLLVLLPWQVLVADPDGSAGHSPADPVVHVLGGFRPEAWVWVVVTLAVAALLLGLVRHLPAGRRDSARTGLATVLPSLLLLGLGSGLMETDQAWWVVSAALGVGAAAAVAAIALRPRDAATLIGGSALFVVLGLDAFAVGLSGELLMSWTGTVATTLAAVAALVARRHHWREVAEPAYGAMAVLLAGSSAIIWADHLDLARATLAWTLVLAAMVVVVAAPRLPTITESRLALEISAGVVAVGALVLAPDLESLALCLTALGSGLALSGVLDTRRDALRWAGAGVLAVSTLVRVAAEVSAPELATLPAAAVLLGVGVHRLRQQHPASSWDLLAPGLGLALMPSLLLALDEPVTLRGALVAAGALLALAVGIERRWSASFLIGAGAAGLLVIRHLTPVADAVPRWISLGAVGLVLLFVGITWEARMRNVATAGRYLRELR